MEINLNSNALKNQLIPVKEFAIKNNITVQAVYQGIKRGKYKSTKFGNYILIVI
jgi:predicted DNA-binding protein YlxM (UPF0122 family)